MPAISDDAPVLFGALPEMIVPVPDYLEGYVMQATDAPGPVLAVAAARALRVSARARGSDVRRGDLGGFLSRPVSFARGESRLRHTSRFTPR